MKYSISYSLKKITLLVALTITSIHAEQNETLLKYIQNKQTTEFENAFKNNDPEEKDFLGFTYVHLACRQRAIGILKFLIKKGANMYAYDKFGRIPMHYFCNWTKNEYRTFYDNNQSLDYENLLTSKDKHHKLTPIHYCILFQRENQDSQVSYNYLASIHDIDQSSHTLKDNIGFCPQDYLDFPKLRRSRAKDIAVKDSILYETIIKSSKKSSNINESEYINVYYPYQYTSPKDEKKITFYTSAYIDIKCTPQEVFGLLKEKPMNDVLFCIGSRQDKNEITYKDKTIDQSQLCEINKNDTIPIQSLLNKGFLRCTQKKAKLIVQQKTYQVIDKKGDKAIVITGPKKKVDLEKNLHKHFYPHKKKIGLGICLAIVGIGYYFSRKKNSEQDLSQDQ